MNNQFDLVESLIAVILIFILFLFAAHLDYLQSCNF